MDPADPIEAIKFRMEHRGSPAKIWRAYWGAAVIIRRDGPCIQRTLRCRCDNPRL